MTVSLNNVTIGSGSVISNVAGRRRLLALTSDFLISITVPAATQPGSLVSCSARTCGPMQQRDVSLAEMWGMQSVEHLQP